MGFSRRQFLKALPPSLFLGGCSSFDSVFTNQKRLFDQEILIVGGGAAGLAAAYHFKKVNQPFKLFEASSRLGGRVYSALLKKNTSVDLGAEFFSSRHITVSYFLKELGLKSQPWKPQNESFLLQGQKKNLESLKPVTSRFVRAVLETQRDLYQGQSVTIDFQNYERFVRSQYYDEMPASELFKSLAAQSSKEIVQAFQKQFEFRYGVSSQDLSALQFLSEMTFEGGSQLILPESLGFFIETLGQRVSGALPDYFVRPQMELVEIDQIPLGLELTFRTPRGLETYFARKVILALPPNQLLKVKGFEKLGLPDFSLKVLQEMRHHKLMKGIKLSSEAGTEVQFLDDVVSWKRTTGEEVSYVAYQNNSGALSLLNTSGPIPEWDLYRNWSRVKNSSTGSHYSRPGFYRSQRGYWNQPFLDGKIYFAGDYTSVRHPQTLEGALSSGVFAAQSILKK